MSHNKNTVNNIEPNRAGEIGQSITALNDVSTSGLATGDTLKYDGVNFVNVPLTNTQYMLIGRGESNAYSNSGATTIDTGDDLYLYDTAPLNTINGSSINKIAGTDWVETVTLPIGKYQILSNCRVSFSASGEFEWTLHNGSIARTGRAIIGESISNYNYSSTLSSSLYITSSETMRIRIIDTASVATVANQGTVISEFSSLYIEKLA